MPRTPRGTTKYLVDALLRNGWTKWRLAFKVEWSPKNDGCGGKTTQQTWQTVDAWSKGKWEANLHNTRILQDLYWEVCSKNKYWPDENK